MTNEQVQVPAPADAPGARPGEGAAPGPAPSPAWAWLWSGVGEKLGPQEAAFGAALSSAQRRSARHAVFRGHAAADAPSARFALMAARSARRQLWLHPVLQAVPILFMGGLFAALAVDAAGDGDWLLVIGGAAVAIAFIPLGLWSPFAYRHLGRGEAANRAVLSADDLARLEAVPPPPRASARSRLGDFAVLAVTVTLVRSLLLGDPLAASAAGGAVFALLLVGVPWGLARLRDR